MAEKEGKQEISPVVAFWNSQIEAYEKKFGNWEKRSKKIIKRYRDERDDSIKAAAQFNILWSNIQTLQPAIYSTPPKPNIDRRFQDEDDLGRYSALVLERAVSYYVSNDLFDKVMNQVTLDRLLPGRGVSWVRYVPVFDESPQITDDADSGVSDEEQIPTLLSEDVIPDYVHWCDFGHTWARTWQEVRAVWRIVPMSRAELVKRFGEKGQTVPLDAKEGGEKTPESGKKATIYEIWDKHKKKAIWIHKSCDYVLDELDDPLHLKDFFPCPEPIYATLSNEDLVPTPDFVLYQDQAIELDTLTGRIAALTKAVKIAGVYDASAEGIDRLLSEGGENILIPVSQWAVMGEKGGLKGAINFLPLQEIMEALLGLYQSRDKVKNDLYEITGISDIVRGATNASETATAQQIKGKFATLRLDNQQKAVARFSRDLVRMFAEIIAEHFSMDTIKQVSGVKLLTAQEKQQIEQVQAMKAQYEQMASQAQQSGQQPPPPPQLPEIPEEVLELVDMPTWEEVEAVIRDDVARSFRIDIETDSTIKTDQEAEKQARTEFLGAVSGFISSAVQAPPDMQPLMMEMLLFGVRGFKVSRELETTFENALNKMRKAAENPQPPPPNPEVEKAQMENQLQQQKMQQEAQIKQGELQQQAEFKQMDLQANAQLEQHKLQANMEIEVSREQIRQQGENERLKMEIGKEIRLEEIRQEGENRRHAVTVANQPVTVTTEV